MENLKAPVKIGQEGDFELFRDKPYYNELICSDNCHYQNTKTSENMGNRILLFIHTFDEVGNDIDEQYWTRDEQKDYVLVENYE